MMRFDFRWGSTSEVPGRTNTAFRQLVHDMALILKAIGGVFVGSYTPGNVSAPDGSYALTVKRLTLTGTERLTLEGTAQLRIV